MHMSDARLVQADRRADRRGRGSRDRADVRRQRFDDPADNGRYAQVHTSSMLPMHSIMCEVCYTDLPTFAQTELGSFQSCTCLNMFEATHLAQRVVKHVRWHECKRSCKSA